MPAHTIRTPHIRMMIDQAKKLASNADGLKGAQLVDVPARDRIDAALSDEGKLFVPAVESIEHAAVLLRHAAAELDAEAQSCRGWRQR